MSLRESELRRTFYETVEATVELFVAVAAVVRIGIAVIAVEMKLRGLDFGRCGELRRGAGWLEVFAIA